MPGESTKLRSALLAEFVAMTLFVWIGCGSAVASLALATWQLKVDNTFLVGVALSFGIGIAVLVFTIAPISGGHINPAVTFALVLFGVVDIKAGLMYWVAQFLGSVLGASILWGCTASNELEDVIGTRPPLNLGSNKVNPNLPLGSAFLLEGMGTFLLCWTVLTTAVSRTSIAGNLAPIAIGWSVFLAHMVLIPFTGCGINPARSFGPMIVSIMAGSKVGFQGWWIFYTAPFVGAAVAALTCKYIFMIESESATPKPDITTAGSSDKTVATDERV